MIQKLMNLKKIKNILLIQKRISFNSENKLIIINK